MVIDVSDWVIAKFTSTSSRTSRYVGQVKSVAADGSDYLEQGFPQVLRTWGTIWGGLKSIHDVGGLKS